MSNKRADVRHPHRLHVKGSCAAGRERSRDPRIKPTSPPAATNELPRRPDAGILSPAIPLFFIGRNGDGFWVARECEGHRGGIFVLKNSAERFTKMSSETTGCATMFVSERFELDGVNHGNPIVGQLAAAKHVASRAASRLAAIVGKAVAKHKI